MLHASAFEGRLFGPGLAGGGTAATGRWHGNTLTLDAGGQLLSIAAASLHIDAAGFNLQQIQLRWQTIDGEFVFFIAQADARAAFTEQAPPALATVLHAAGRRERKMGRSFGVVVALYVMILALPVLLLIGFLMQTDRIAAWVADKVPIQYEEKIGDLALAQTRARYQLLDSGPAYDAVTTIGDTLTTGSRYTYRWYLVDSDEVNAFAAPGGVVVVYRGLLAKTDSPEELAGVLAHEVAHVERRHSLGKLIKSAGFSVLLSLATGDVSGSALGNWVARLTDLKFSRDAEMEADRDGLRRLVAARIAPQPTANFFAKLAHNESRASSPLALLSTHPPSQQRMVALQAQIAQLAPTRYVSLPLDWATVKGSLSAAN